MPFRGYLSLNGAELSNSSRVVDHLHGIVPTMDAEVWGDPNDGSCDLQHPMKNHVIDPGMHTVLWDAMVDAGDATREPTIGLHGGQSFRLYQEDSGTNPAVLFTPDTAETRFITAEAEQWYCEAWFYCDPNSPHPASCRVQAVVRDSTDTLSPTYSATTSTVIAPGQWGRATATITIPAGYDRVAFRGGLTGADEALAYVTAPVVNRLGEEPEEFFAVPSTDETRPGLFDPPPGSRMYGRSMFEHDGTCWLPRDFCGVSQCLQIVSYDDTWPGLKQWLDESLYRVELAPWFSTRIPESGEFAGLWMMDVRGLNTTAVEREIVQAVGNGGVAMPHRDLPRTLEFDALLVACTNAGLEYGLSWLTNTLRSTKDRSDSVLRFFKAHPEHTAADPDSLLREVRGVVYTGAPEITEAFAPTGQSHHQATMYRVRWTMGVTSPYAYLPTTTISVDWEKITPKRVNWLHAADCEQPYTCLDMPVMFSAECPPEEIPVVATPPPVCGGCMPVCTMLQHAWVLPGTEDAYRSAETAVGIEIINHARRPLSLQAFWRVCGSDVRCENSLWPLQVAGLPGGVSLTLDSVSGQFWTNFDNRRWRPRGIVGTPNGAPWRPVVLDRSECWELVVITPDQADFDVRISLTDREP